MCEERQMDFCGGEGLWEELLKEPLCGLCRFRCDERLSIIFANDYFYALFDGHTQKPFPSSIADCLSPEEFERLSKTLEVKRGAGERFFSFENEIPMGRGVYTWLVLRCAYDYDAGMITCAVMDITPFRQREEDLLIKETASRILLQQNQILTVQYQIASQSLHCPPEIAAHFGIPPVISNWPEAAGDYPLVPEEYKDVYFRFFEDCRKGKASGGATFPLRDREGILRWFRSDFTLVKSPQGEPLYDVVSLVDISELREKELAYEKWKQLYESQREDSLGFYEANLTTDTIERIEGAVAPLLSKEPHVSLAMLIHLAADKMVLPEDREAYKAFFDRDALMKRYVQGDREGHYEHRRVDSSGKVVWAVVDYQMFPDPFTDGIRCFGLVKNIDREKQDRLALVERSQMDALTGVFNRATVIERIEASLASFPDSGHAVIMLDIDYFKQLNDTMGHAFGDLVLQEIASLLKHCIREGDLVGRIGGDEFILLLKNIPLHQSLERKLCWLCENVRKDYEQITVTCSMGGAVYPRDGKTFEELYRKADVALYESKRLGRNQATVYSIAHDPI